MVRTKDCAHKELWLHPAKSANALYGMTKHTTWKMRKISHKENQLNLTTYVPKRTTPWAHHLYVYHTHIQSLLTTAHHEGSDVRMYLYCRPLTLTTTHHNRLYFANKAIDSLRSFCICFLWFLVLETPQRREEWTSFKCLHSSNKSCFFFLFSSNESHNIYEG